MRFPFPLVPDWNLNPPESVAAASLSPFGTRTNLSGVKLCHTYWSFSPASQLNGRFTHEACTASPSLTAFEFVVACGGDVRQIQLVGLGKEENTRSFGLRLKAY
jgi:hypothetical protein